MNRRARAVGRRRSHPRPLVALALPPASRHTPSTRPTRAACRSPSTSPVPATTVALSFIFVLVRDVRAERPIVTDPGHAAASRAALRAARRRPDRLGLDRRPGHRRRHEQRRGLDAVPVGLRLGRRGRSSRPSSGRSGTAWIRSRRCTTSAPAVIRRLGVRPWDVGRLPRAARALAGGRRVRASSSGSSSSSQAEPGVLFIVLVGYTALTLAMMAQFGRDTWRSQRRGLHGLVPAARPPGAVRAGRRGRAGSADVRSRAGCSSRAGRWPDVVIDRARRRLDPVRRPVADPDLVRPVRAARRCRAETVLLVGFLGHHRRARRSP